MRKLIIISLILASQIANAQMQCPQVKITCSDTLDAPIDSIALIARVVANPLDPIKSRGWFDMKGNSLGGDSVMVHGIKSTSFYKYRLQTSSGIVIEGYDVVTVIPPVVKPRSVIMIDWNLRKIIYDNGDQTPL